MVWKPSLAIDEDAAAARPVVPDRRDMVPRTVAQRLSGLHADVGGVVTRPPELDERIGDAQLVVGMEIADAREQHPGAGRVREIDLHPGFEREALVDEGQPG